MAEAVAVVHVGLVMRMQTELRAVAVGRLFASQPARKLRRPAVELAVVGQAMAVQVED